MLTTKETSFVAAIYRIIRTFRLTEIPKSLLLGDQASTAREDMKAALDDKSDNLVTIAAEALYNSGEKQNAETNINFFNQKNTHKWMIKKFLFFLFECKVSL